MLPNIRRKQTGVVLAKYRILKHKVSRSLDENDTVKQPGIAPFLTLALSHRLILGNACSV